jgi:hypothetical protein
MNQMILCCLRRPHRGQARSYSGMCLPIDDRSALGAGRVKHGARFDMGAGQGGHGTRSAIGAGRGGHRAGFAIGNGGADDDRARFCINAGGAGRTLSPVGARLPANAAGRPLQVLELT